MDSTGIVDAQSGEVATPQEAIERYRELEAGITRADARIAAVKNELKEARAARETAVKDLRWACREAKTLPLFEGVKASGGQAAN